MWPYYARSDTVTGILFVGRHVKNFYRHFESNIQESSHVGPGFLRAFARAAGYPCCQSRSQCGRVSARERPESHSRRVASRSFSPSRRVAESERLGATRPTLNYTEWKPLSLSLSPSRSRSSQVSFPLFMHCEGIQHSTDAASRLGIMIDQNAVPMRSCWAAWTRSQPAGRPQMAPSRASGLRDSRPACAAVQEESDWQQGGFVTPSAGCEYALGL